MFSRRGFARDGFLVQISLTLFGVDFCLTVHHQLGKVI